MTAKFDIIEFDSLHVENCKIYVLFILFIFIYYETIKTKQTHIVLYFRHDCSFYYNKPVMKVGKQLAKKMVHFITGR